MEKQRQPKQDSLPLFARLGAQSLGEPTDCSARRVGVGPSAARPRPSEGSDVRKPHRHIQPDPESASPLPNPGRQAA